MTQAKQPCCKACKQPITWIKTKAGKFMPTDPDGKPHWATCPNADAFRSDRTQRRQVESVLLSHLDRLSEGN